MMMPADLYERLRCVAAYDSLSMGEVARTALEAAVTIREEEIEADKETSLAAAVRLRDAANGGRPRRGRPPKAHKSPSSDFDGKDGVG